MSEQPAGLLARRRARGLWVRGARRLGFAKDGEKAATPDKPAALESFTKAVALDGGMTDAWLGFHAAGGDADTALDRMVAGIDRFGEERDADRRRLSSTFQAGYSAPMAEFLEANPGLRSRFSTRIDFPRYTADQLREIAVRLVESHGDHITDDGVAALTAVLDQVCADGRIDEVGNARFIRTVLEAASKHRDLRLFQSPGTPTDLELVTLEVTDLRPALTETLSF